MIRKRESYGINEMVERILGPNDTLTKNGSGDSMGVGDGYYDATHRNLRVHWHDTIKRLVGRNKISEIIQHSSAQVNRYLAREDTKEGIDPREIFMNGTMNVVTGFSLGVLYDFDDQEFKNLAKYVRVFFENMRNMYVNKIIVDILPLWMTQNWLYQLIVRKPLAGITETVPRFTEYILIKVKEHRATLDIASPRDFLDILLIAAENDSRLGHFTITSSIVALYLGASDTLSNQMRWLCFTLADHPEVQEKMFDEIRTSIKKDSEIIKENCPFTRSVLLENMRWHPVVDTLPHRATEDTEIQGVPIPNKAVVQASLTAVMHDPKNFVEPEKFIPDRFVKNGIFVNDVKVCGFSLGLRNCIGKQLAIEEYFIFASNMVNSFRIERTAGDINHIANHSAILMPEGSRVCFVSRSC